MAFRGERRIMEHRNDEVSKYAPLGGREQVEEIGPYRPRGPDPLGTASDMT